MGRAAAVIGLVILGIAVAYLVSKSVSIILVVFAGVLFGVLLDALAVALARRSHLSRKMSLGVVIVVLLVLLSATGWFIGPRISEQMSELGTKIPDALREIRTMLAGTSFGQFILDQIPSNPGSAIGFSKVQGAFSTLAGGVGNMFLAAFVAIYTAFDPDLYKRGVIHLVPPPHRPRAREVLDALGRALRHWLGGQIAAMAVVGILTSVGLFIVGIPLALSLGLIAALLAFVPYLGPIAAVIPAVMVGLLESPMTAVYVLVVYAVVQFCESYLITPLIQKRAVSLPPALLIVSQVIGGVVFGVVGIVLATPLTVCIMVLVQMLYVEDVLGDEEVTVLGSD